MSGESFQEDGEISNFLNSRRKMSDFEKKLFESDEKFKALARAVQAMVWITAPNGEVLLMSNAWQKFTGQTEEEAKGGGWAKMVHPNDLARATVVWKQAVATSSPYISKYRLYCTIDKTYHTTYSKGFPVMNPDGSIKEWIGATMDIDSVYCYKEESDFMKQRFECLSNSLGHLMWYADKNGKLLFLNNTWEGLTD